MFARQKGASRADIWRLEHGLRRLARHISHDVGIEGVARMPGAGAGGGLGAGLVAFLGASLFSGFDSVARVTQLEKSLDNVTLVVTGEGHLDRQSLAGKVPVSVAQLAGQHDIPCIAVVGRVSLNKDELDKAGFASAVSIAEAAGTRRAFDDPGRALRITTAMLLLQGDLHGSGRQHHEPDDRSTHSRSLGSRHRFTK